ncbi:MAG: flagellar basal-body MS-ring/collar protein FliF [Actinomycetota bacterium]|nr:flagellar basal-body MS-ring/collar protein FliF [Actinomycetota bacterium]
MAISDALEQIRMAWRKLNLNQKLVFVITIFSFTLGLIALSYWAVRPSYSVLFSNLSSDDAASIVSVLKEQSIPYRLKGASVIEVPAGQVYDARLTVATEGLPSGGGVGFEIFDQSSLGTSEFNQKVNLRRAIEGELARTISGLSEIEGARVHIVVPEESLYEEDEEPSTASVVLKTRAAAKISANQVRAVVHLVASSVEGLKPENITILDDQGNLLSEATGDASTLLASGMTQNQLEAQVAYESKLEKSIQTMLEKFLGKGKSVVRVSAELDFMEKTVESEIYEQGDTPILRSESSVKEKYAGEGSVPAGTPGVDSTNPTYPTTQTGGTSEYSKTDSTKNYEVTKHLQQEIDPPGEIMKLSIAVVLDSTTTDRVQPGTVEEAISAAAGLDTDRGDILTVSTVPFDTTQAEQDAAELEEFMSRERTNNIIRMVALALFFLLGAFFLNRMLSNLRKRKPEIAGFEAFSVAAPSDFAMGEEETTPEERERKAIKEQVKKIAKDKPDEVAGLIKMWLTSKE